jgi:hypothetical protein
MLHFRNEARLGSGLILGSEEDILQAIAQEARPVFKNGDIVHDLLDGNNIEEMELKLNLPPGWALMYYQFEGGPTTMFEHGSICKDKVRLHHVRGLPPGKDYSFPLEIINRHVRVEAGLRPGDIYWWSPATQAGATNLIYKATIGTRIQDY